MSEAVTNFGRQMLALFRVLKGSVGKRMAKRAAPAYLAIGLASSLICGRSGLGSREILEMERSGGLFLFLGWILLTAPAARQVLAGSELAYLLSIPVSRWQLGGAIAAHFALLNTYWIALWARTGALGTLGTTALCMAANGILARPLTPLTGAALASLAMTIAIGPDGACLAVGAVTLAWSLRGLLRQAGEHTVQGSSSARLGLPIARWAIAHWLALWREERVLLWRAGIGSFVTLSIAWLAIVNNRITAPGLTTSLCLAIGGVAASIAAAGLSIRLVETDFRETWLLESLGVSKGFRWSSAAIVVACICGALGVAQGVGVSLLARLRPSLGFRVTVSSMLWFASLGVFVARAAFAFNRQTEDENSRLLLSVVAITATAPFAVGFIGEWLLAPTAVAALIAGLPQIAPLRGFEHEVFTREENGGAREWQ